MNEKPKSKILVSIIGILLVANIVMLSFLIWKNDADRKQRINERDNNSRSKAVKEYLRKEIGFSETQLADYDSLSKKHRQELKTVFNSLAAERKKTFKILADASFSDSAIEQAAAVIHASQPDLEKGMLTHLKDIRNLCTPEQKTRFDSSFYKIFGRRGDSHKEK
ncbi:MAG: periplasmic heavy metal sensor [Bacteroidetes bacterium]|jgi:hypothetical protein|nr:periplasmic heavy metal sensor [Bacteroidota bacterium]